MLRCSDVLISPGAGEAAEVKQRAASGDARTSATTPGETSFSSGADTTVDSHRDFLRSVAGRGWPRRTATGARVLGLFGS